VPFISGNLPDILCEQHERKVDKDNCVRFEGLSVAADRKLTLGQYSIGADSVSDDAVTASWVTEAKQRNNDISAGRAKAVPAAEFRKWFNSL
jgi:hypothetical protein